MSDNKTTPEAHEVEAAIKSELKKNPGAGRKSIHQAIKKKNSNCRSRSVWARVRL